MEDKRKCPKCSTEVSVNEKFCYRCGYSFENDKPAAEEMHKPESFLKSGKGKGVIALVVIVLIGAAGYFGYASHQRQQVQSYLTEANTYVTEIAETTIDLSYINDAWDITEAGSWLYYGTVKSYAKTMFSSNINRAEDAFKSIESHYNTLKNMDTNGSDMQGVKEKVEDLHLAYETVYSMIVLFESGNNSAKISELKVVTSEFQTLIQNVADEWKITIDKEDEGDNQEI